MHVIHGVEIKLFVDTSSSSVKLRLLLIKRKLNYIL